MIPLREIFDIPQGLLDIDDAKALPGIMPHPIV